MPPQSFSSREPNRKRSQDAADARKRSASDSPLCEQAADIADAVSCNRLPPVVSLIGKANSGKTTLLEKLIPALTAHGLRVGTIKHHVHAFDMDRPGKDTWRHKKAGASVVALSSPTGLGLVRDTDRDLPLAEVVSRYFDDVDLVLTEGYKSGPAPKVEIFRPEVHQEPLSNRDETWLALVSDTPLAYDLPVFALDDAADLARFLIDTLLGNRQQNPSRLPDYGG